MPRTRERGVVGAAVGYALSGGRVVAELMYADFMGRAGDEIFNQMAKWQGMSAPFLQIACGARGAAGGVPVEYYEVPLGEPAIRCAGSDITLVTVGATLYRALDAADELH